MEIIQTREMSKDMFLSLSDEMKLQMARQQFSFPIKDLDTLYPWLNENADVFYLEQIKETVFIFFFAEEDATAFKLTWM